MIKIDAVFNKFLKSSQSKKKLKSHKNKRKTNQNLLCLRKIKTLKIKTKKVLKLIHKCLFLKSPSNKLVSTYLFRKMSLKKSKQQTSILLLE